MSCEDNAPQNPTQLPAINCHPSPVTLPHFRIILLPQILKVYLTRPLPALGLLVHLRYHKFPSKREESRLRLRDSFFQTTFETKASPPWLLTRKVRQLEKMELSLSHRHHQATLLLPQMAAIPTLQL